MLNDPSHAKLNRFLRSYAATIKKPDAIIIISAHWEEPVIAITAAQLPSLLFDYYGFPPETYRYQYPASGNPELAERVHEMLRQAEIDARLDHERGFDHGVFVPLLLMYPDASTSCIQVSLSTSLDPTFHVRIGQALNKLRSENLLILGSGFSFHNMQALMSKHDDLIDERNQVAIKICPKLSAKRDLPDGSSPPTHAIAIREKNIYYRFTFVMESLNRVRKLFFRIKWRVSSPVPINGAGKIDFPARTLRDNSEMRLSACGRDLTHRVQRNLLTRGVFALAAMA